MADSSLHSLTNKATPDTTDELYLVQSPFGAGDDRRATLAQIDTVLSATSKTLTNKTISLGSNTVSGTTAQFNSALSDGDFATLAGSETLSNKTLTAPKFADGGFIADASGNEQLAFDSNASAVNYVEIANAATGTAVHIHARGDDAAVGLHIGAKAGGYVNIEDGTDETKRLRFDVSGATTGKIATLTSSHTVDRTITLPDATDTLVGKATTDTLTNKTIAGAAISGALTGTGAYIPVTLLNSGTSASASTFWRGDGTWATPTAAVATSLPIVWSCETLATASQRYGTSIGGNGTITATNGGLTVTSGTTAGESTLLLFYLPLVTSSLDYDDDPTLFGTIALGTIPANWDGSWRFGFGYLYGSTKTLTDEHACIVYECVNGVGTMYASNANGTTQTTTDINSAATWTQVNHVAIVMDSGTNVKFYVNNVLAATHTTNLPNGAFNSNYKVGSFTVSLDGAETTNYTGSTVANVSLKFG